MKLEPYIKAIPEGSHGSGTLQKRLWKACSDYCRIRDFHNFGTCVATGKYLESWQSCDGGHYIPYSTCNGIFKFSPENVHAQSSGSNKWGGERDKIRYQLELEERYGKKYPRYLIKKNRDTPNTLRTEELKDLLKEILLEMKDLPEQPSYFARVMSLI